MYVYIHVLPKPTCTYVYNSHLGVGSFAVKHVNIYKHNDFLNCRTWLMNRPARRKFSGEGFPPIKSETSFPPIDSVYIQKEKPRKKWA